mgnify:CR=1 FL=1
MDQGSDTAELLLIKGGLFDGNFAFYISGVAVYVFVGVTAVYTMFLLALWRIALAILFAGLGFASLGGSDSEETAATVTTTAGATATPAPRPAFTYANA